MRVLLSIKPEFASKIFDGSKEYEYRRTIFKRDEVTTVVVYACNPISKIIGEFEIGEILHEKPEVLWAKTGNQGGITKKSFLQYFKDKNDGYAIRVKKAKVYRTAVSLDSLLMSVPPQSFAYL